MKTIQMDDDVYEHLQQKAIAYEEAAPGQTLRRLLGLPRRPPLHRAPRTEIGRRGQKADLEVLRSAHFLKADEVLELRDYQGRKVAGAEATLAGGRLVYNGRKYSMSALAAMFLKRKGYKADAVRGPAHRFTRRGQSVKELWEEFLAS